MRIHFLLVKDLFKGGGIETYTRGVARRLVKRGHDVTVYSTGGDKHSPPTWEGMKIVWLPRITPYWAEKFCGAMMAAYLEFTTDSPDVIHLHSVAAGSMAAILRHRRALCVVQMHGVEWKRSRWGTVARYVLKAMEKCSLAYGHAFTAVSRTQCEYYLDRYGTRCEYIPTAVELKERTVPRLILDLKLQPGQYLLFAARLVPEKGAHYLIPAFRRLRTNHRLAIAGEPGHSDAYRRHLRELAAGDERIIFLGDARGRLLDELYSNAAAFVLPSEIEGLSIGLMEAMSYGLPCVASDIPENREVIADAGLLFRNKDIDDLERALNVTIAARTDGTDMGERARGRVKDLFCWELVVDRLEDLYTREYPVRESIRPGEAPHTVSSANPGIRHPEEPRPRSTSAGGD
jgi:glycosyltransferase involved in cell wall biosynthesis